MQSYGRLCTQYYDLDKPKPPPDALAFYQKQVQSANGPTLEPMCGSGRFLIPLMRAGFKVIGVDSSHPMLSACRMKAHALGLNPTLYQQYLHEMDVPGKYCLAMIPSGSFGLITDESEARKSLRRIHRHLCPGGRFVLELDRLLEEPATHQDPSESTITRPDGSQIKMIASGQFDPVVRVYHGINRYERFKQGQSVEQEVEHFDLCYYEPCSMTCLLEESGFKVLDIHTAFNPSIPVKESKSFVLIARRL